MGSDNYLITEIFPSFPFWLAVRFEYLSVIVPLFFASLFIDKLLPGRVPRWVVLTFLVLFGIQALIVVFTPIYVFTYLVYTNLILLLSSILVYTFIFVKAAIDGEQGSIFIFISFLSMSASMTLEILVYLEVIHTVPIIAVLLQILFVFSLAMILGVRFAMSFNNVEILQRQTKENEFEEIKADLRNIGGNVFTKDFRFQTIELDMNKYKTFYFMSDGYQYQFGGENRKKFSKTKIKGIAHFCSI